jgi:hypothetical protein
MNATGTTTVAQRTDIDRVGTGNRKSTAAHLLSNTSPQPAESPLHNADAAGAAPSDVGQGPECTFTNSPLIQAPTPQSRTRPNRIALSSLGFITLGLLLISGGSI